jgi:hypothetical protein
LSFIISLSFSVKDMKYASVDYLTPLKNSEIPLSLINELGDTKGLGVVPINFTGKYALIRMRDVHPIICTTCNVPMQICKTTNPTGSFGGSVPYHRCRGTLKTGDACKKHAYMHFSLENILLYKNSPEKIIILSRK